MDEPTPTPRKRYWFPTVAVVLLVIVAALFVVDFAYQRSTSRFLKRRAEAALQVKLETLKAEGLPLTFAELDKWYTTPPSNQNAATAILQAFDLYAPAKSSPGRSGVRWLAPTDQHQGPEPIDPIQMIQSGKLPPAEEPLSAEVKDAITQVVTKNEAALQLLHAGARMPASRYPIDLTKGSSIMLPHLNGIAYGSRLLTLEMMLAAENGDSESAVQSAEAAFGLARSLAAEPLQISQAMRVRCLMTVAKNLERVLSRLTLTEGQSTRLESALIQGEDPEGVHRAYVTARCQTIENQRQWREAMSKPFPFWPTWQECHDLTWRDIYPFLVERIGAQRYATSGLFELDVIVSLEIRTAYIRASQLPFPEMVTAAKDIAEQEDRYERGGTSFLIQPAQRLAVTSLAKCVSQLRAARGALMLERARRAEGRLPEQVETILPADPFTGQPLKFKKVANGYVVYGVGADGGDDGGDEKKDITFRVFR